MLDNKKQFSVADVKCMRGVMGGYIDRHLEGLCISVSFFTQKIMEALKNFHKRHNSFNCT